MRICMCTICLSWVCSFHEHVYRLLLEGGYEIDVVFTSRLKRAIRTVWIILSELNEVYLPVFKSWRLQERHYGALTGLSKKELAEQVGADLVQTWYVLCVCVCPKIEMN